MSRIIDTYSPYIEQITICGCKFVSITRSSTRSKISYSQAKTLLQTLTNITNFLTFFLLKFAHFLHLYSPQIPLTQSTNKSALIGFR